MKGGHRCAWSDAGSCGISSGMQWTEGGGTGEQGGETAKRRNGEPGNRENGETERRRAVKRETGVKREA